MFKPGPWRPRRGSGNFEVGLTRAGVALTLDALQTQRLRLVLSLGPSLGAFHVAVREPAPVDPGDFLFAAVELVSSRLAGRV